MTHPRYFTRAVSSALLSLCLAACGKPGDYNLWTRDFAKPRSDPSVTVEKKEVRGYWEGEISMGSIRTRIDTAQITVAIRCDAEGRIVAQGSAAIVLRDDGRAMVLQEDLAGGNQDCGFRFNKGNEFTYELDPDGALMLNFAGTSVSRLRKLAGLDT